MKKTSACRKHDFIIITEKLLSLNPGENDLLGQLILHGLVTEGEIYALSDQLTVHLLPLLTMTIILQFLTIRLQYDYIMLKI